MCLAVLIQIPDDAPGRIGAKRLGELANLVVTTTKLDGETALHLSVSGGCSCEFLAKGPHQHDGRWELDPAQVPKLSTAVLALTKEAKKFRLIAYWMGGDAERREMRVSGSELVALIEGNRLEDNVLYRTWAGS